ncbi:acyl-CoA dehydrogenase [Kitasatospora sp. NPDC054939]
MTTAPADTRTAPAADGTAGPDRGLFADLDTPVPLERLFGDPHDPQNPLGFAGIVAADERGDLPFAGERLLDAFGLGAEFVPTRLGGRLAEADRLARVLRPLFRRDAALGLGHGASNLVGSVNVWSAGSAAQQRRVADILLRNGRIAAAYTDMATGNDVARSAFQARIDGRQLRLTGRKEIINNLARAEAITVLARTSDEPGSRSHSMVLLDRAELPREGVHFLPRYRTVGVRGLYLGGVEFRDCAVPLETVAGRLGEAFETILRAFQVTRSTLPAAAVGTLDTQLRTVLDFALERRLYGRTVAELPHARSVLAGAFLDLLVCDSLATTACRALHLLPQQTNLYSAAVKYLVPLLMRDSVDELATVLGARSFLREGPHAIFQKHLRDLPIASLVHAGGTVCQATVIPQLPRLARRSWLNGPGAPAELFRLDAPLPELDMARLGISSPREDSLLATLPEIAAEVSEDRPLRALCDLLLAELAELKRRCAELAPRDRTPLASPASFAYAERYALLLAAASCLGVWRYNRHHPSAFVTDTRWLTAALARLTARLGHPPVAGLDGLEADVFAELVERHGARRDFDLVGRRFG